MVAYSDLVKGIRDTWKGRSEALKAAENQNQEDKIPAIKREVIFQRRMIDLVVNVALESGHPAIVRRYVGFLFFVAVVSWSVGQDRASLLHNRQPPANQTLKQRHLFLNSSMAFIHMRTKEKRGADLRRKGQIEDQISRTLVQLMQLMQHCRLAFCLRCFAMNLKFTTLGWINTYS